MSDVVSDLLVAMNDLTLSDSQVMAEFMNFVNPLNSHFRVKTKVISF